MAVGDPGDVGRGHRSCVDSAGDLDLPGTAKEEQLVCVRNSLTSSALLCIFGVSETYDFRESPFDVHAKAFCTAEFAEHAEKSPRN